MSDTMFIKQNSKYTNIKFNTSLALEQTSMIDAHRVNI